MSKHPPEPWMLDDDYGILDKTNSIVVDQDHPHSYLERIVACVNACEGISTEDLVDVGEKPGEFKKDLERVITEYLNLKGFLNG